METKMYYSKFLLVILLMFCWACQDQATSSPKDSHNGDEHTSGDGHEHTSGDDHEHTSGDDHEHTSGDDHKHTSGDEQEHASGDGHEHEYSPLSLDEIEKKQCEHNIRQLDCNDCRSELGVVKLDENIQKKMIQTNTVKTVFPTISLQINGEVQLNSLKTVSITPMVTGRIIKIHRKVGEIVKTGDLLVTLESQEYAKLKLDYISAVHKNEIADKNLEWVNLAHQNLRQLLNALQKGHQNGDLALILSNLKMGKYKQELIEVAAIYRNTKLKYEQEKQVLQNLAKLLELLQSNKTDIESEIKPLLIGEWKTKTWGAYARFVFADKNYQREKTLSFTGASTQKELQEAENAYLSAKADYDGVKEEATIWISRHQFDIQAELELATAKYQTILEELSQDLQIHKLETEKEAIQATLEQATAKRQLSLLGLTQTELSALLQENGKDNFGTLAIRSPIAGTIVSSYGSEGQMVEPQKELCTISDLSTLWVCCDVYETDVAYLSASGQKIKAEVLALNHKIPGELEYIADMIDEKTRTLKIRVSVSDSNKILRPGMFVKVQLNLTQQEKALLIPEPALFEDQDRRFVFKKWKESFWIRTDVKLGAYYGQQIEITQGLIEGDQIVTHGGFILKSEILKNKMGAG